MKIFIPRSMFDEICKWKTRPYARDSWPLGGIIATNQSSQDFTSNLNFDWYKPAIPAYLEFFGPFGKYEVHPKADEEYTEVRVEEVRHYKENA